MQYIFHHLILVGDAVPKKVARWIPQGSKFRFGSLCIFSLSESLNSLPHISNENG